MKQEDGIPSLLTLLLDTESQWDVPQKQVLALAQHLTAAGQYAPLICCPKDSPLAQRAIDAGLQHMPLAPNAAGNLFSRLRYWFFQRHHRTLLLHSFSSEALHLGARLVQWRKPGITALVHSCFDAVPLPPFKDEKIIDKAWLAADKILCPHTVLRASLIKAGLDSARLSVVHPACDMADLPAHKTRPPHEGNARFVFMALENLREGNGLFVLLRAMSALWQRTDLPPWEVRVTGEGPAFDTLLDEARSLGVESRLALLSRQKLTDVLPCCDALLAPSRLPQGNLAALMAAWCAELPLVCSAVPGHMELAKAEQSALTVPPGDAQALAAAMIRLMQEVPIRQDLVEHGRTLCAHATYARMADQCQKMYADCVARHGWVLPPINKPKAFAEAGAEAAAEAAVAEAGAEAAEAAEAAEIAAPSATPPAAAGASVPEPSTAEHAAEASLAEPSVEQTKEIHEV